MVLMAADGLRNDQIAVRLRCGRDSVPLSQWRKRSSFEQRLTGLEDRPRRGGPALPLPLRAPLPR